MPDIQKLIDQLFLKNPKLAEYIEWAKYVPQSQENGPFPDGATDVLMVQKVEKDGKLGPKIVVAVRVDGPYDTFLHALEAAL